MFINIKTFAFINNLNGKFGTQNILDAVYLDLL